MLGFFGGSGSKKSATRTNGAENDGNPDDTEILYELVGTRRAALTLSPGTRTRARSSPISSPSSGAFHSERRSLRLIRHRQA